MVDLPTVCCLCGDIGFQERLFQCSRCQSRFQHSYCTSFYGEAAMEGLCDWCQSDGRNVDLSKMSASLSERKERGRSQNPDRDSKRKHKEKVEGSDKGGTNSAVKTTPSPRQVGRRYKLLKDVLC